MQKRGSVPLPDAYAGNRVAAGGLESLAVKAWVRLGVEIEACRAEQDYRQQQVEPAGLPPATYGSAATD